MFFACLVEGRFRPQETNMKALRISALMLAVPVFSICSIPVHAQQEIDPDHFDQPTAASMHARGAKTQSHHSTTAAKPPSGRKVATAPSRKTHSRQNTHRTSGSNDVLGE